jgi:ATP-dependent DNA ligase
MLLAASSSFIEPCLPSAADRPPSGSNWIHEIKHDGYRLMARRDPVGIRLITRRGSDWTNRFPLVVEAVNRLKVRSCLIDGESRHGMRLNEHLDHPEGDIVFQHACKVRLE